MDSVNVTSTIRFVRDGHANIIRGKSNRHGALSGATDWKVDSDIERVETAPEGWNLTDDALRRPEAAKIVVEHQTISEGVFVSC